MARMTAPNGAVVNVDDSKVDALKARGYNADKGKAEAEADKPATSSKSSRSSKSSTE